MIRTLAAALATSTCIMALATPAAAQTREYNIPAGSLKSALDAYVRQSGRQVVYRSDQVRSARSPGVRGQQSAAAALAAILVGSGFITRTDGDLVAIVKSSGNGQAVDSLPAAEEASVKSTTAEIDNAEIVVTAQKQAQRLQDVPVPVTALRASELAQQNQIRLQDYYAKVPGLSLALVSDASQPLIAIRGITTGGFTNPTVGIVVDELPYGATVTGNVPAIAPDVDPGDLERVEVLRGPQGTLYGAASMGGLLKFVTVEPSLTSFKGRIEGGVSSVSHGDKAGYSVRASANMPLGETLALRASGFTLRDAGFVDNLRNGDRDINSTSSTGGRLSMLWKPAEEVSVKLGAAIQDYKRRGTSDVDTALAPSYSQSRLPGSGVYQRKTKIFNATINAQLDSAEITSATGFSIDESFTNIDGSDAFAGDAQREFGVTGSATPTKLRYDKFSQELRARIELSDRIDWLVGAFYTNESSKVSGRYTANDSTTGAEAGTLLTITSPLSYREIAGFTNLAIEFTDRFNVQFGARFSNNRQTFATSRNGPLSALYFGSNPSLVEEVASSDNVFTYLVTPQFKISPELMLYGRIATGYRPGGPNSGCGIVGLPCKYKADTTRNYEIGFKGDLFDRKLTFDASAYHIDWQDIQLQFLIFTPVFFSYLDNASRAKSEGVELSLEARPFPGTTLSGSLSWNNAKLTRDVPAGSTINARRGDRLPYSSPFTAFVSLSQRLTISDQLTADIGGDASFVGNRKGSFQPGPTRETFPHYTQINLHARLDYDSWGLSAFVTNLTDQRGVLRGGLDANFGHPSFFTYIQPRTVGLSISKTF